ncbi:MAG TPA: lamin tail domain-containing protein, partial [Gemmatimonadaceae bacterium]
MRLHSVRGALALLAAFGLLSCSETPTAVKQSLISAHGANRDATNGLPSVVISQIYGGGGNSGATLTNDFIELFNPGSSVVDLSGWSVQYASSAGTAWQVTNLSGSIQPGGYYLVQESKGTGGTTPLPTADATGTIAMSATAGKVLVTATTTAQSGTCPAGASDLVSFGTAATDCGAKTTATLTNTTAAIRGQSGCSFTGDNSADFSSGAPAPRNMASTAIAPCTGGGIQPAGPLDHVAVTGPTDVTPGSTIQLVATPQDLSNKTITGAAITWASDHAEIASVDQTGKVTGVVASTTAATITATAVANGITKSGTHTVTVSAASIKFIDLSASSTSFPAGFQAQIFPTARTASGGTIIPATFVFEAVNPEIATVA